MARPRTPPPAPETATSDDDSAPTDFTLLNAILDRTPAIDDAVSRVFYLQFAEARCVDTGSMTRGSAILREAIRVVVDAEPKLANHPSIPYAQTRFRHLLDAIRDLGARLRTENLARGNASLKRAENLRAESEARSARKALDHKLDTVTLGDAAATDKLVQARASTDAAVPQAAILDALAAVADAWLKRKDTAAAILAAGSKLTADDVTRARLAAKQLRQADDALRGNRVTVHDSAEVNAREGRVILEIGVLDKAIQSAQESIPGLTELPLGKSLRRVLRTRPRATGAADGEIPVASTPVASTEPATGPAAATTPRVAKRTAARRKPARRGR